jgi:hypothetical protein
MWLEQTAWVWLPIAAGMGAWLVWRTLQLSRQVRDLQQRLDLLGERRDREKRRLHRVA